MPKSEAARHAVILKEWERSFGRLSQKQRAEFLVRSKPLLDFDIDWVLKLIPSAGPYLTAVFKALKTSWVVNDPQMISEVEVGVEWDWVLEDSAQNEFYSEHVPPARWTSSEDSDEPVREWYDWASQDGDEHVTIDPSWDGPLYRVCELWPDEYPDEGEFDERQPEDLGRQLQAMGFHTSWM